MIFSVVDQMSLVNFIGSLSLLEMFVCFFQGADNQTDAFFLANCEWFPNFDTSCISNL